ncbi:MAG TPA: glycoside hydrolase family 43 protein [Polyangiaceae bacterium]|nr:glycoside hydrolase family 43 protein [Polyangiaceae bacterium]
MRSVAEFEVSSALFVIGVLVLGAAGCNASSQGDDASGGTSASGGSAGTNLSSAGRASSGSSNGGANGGGGGSAVGGDTTGGRPVVNGGAPSAGNGGASGMSTSTAGTTSGGGAGGAGGAPAVVDETVAWVLSYFGPEQSVAADSLHLAYSTDGLHWTRLGSGAPAYQLTGLGTNHIRDPFILRKHDGSFVFIATDWTLSNNDSNYWNNPSSKILVASSRDLITFNEPHLLTLTTRKGSGGKAMHAWAPEAYYDAAADRYAIIWSGNDSADRNRIYVSYTQDFETTTSAEPEVLFDPGYSVIDGTVAISNGASYLFFKDETDNDGGSLTGSGKDIQVAQSSSAQLSPGAFTRVDAAYIPRGTSQATRQATEGPFVIKDPKRDLWYLYADFYTQGGVFGCWSTPDLSAKPSSWTRVAAADYSLPAGVRHANTVRVSQAELDALKAHYK